MTHRIDIGAWVVTCSCGWAYDKPFWFFETSRTNRAIREHLSPDEAPEVLDLSGAHIERDPSLDRAAPEMRAGFQPNRGADR
jgi:hypothetical protein